jgi:hypothetical protein
MRGKFRLKILDLMYIILVIGQVLLAAKAAEK